jgi:LmbE family N-acetylglucosaminyl deacetylase
MPIEPVALFVFAHQDDEFGVFERIVALRRQGIRVACAYLSDGQTATGSSTAVRNAESLSVLARLGVAASDVTFAGEQLGIGDARLPLHLDAAGQWLAAWFDSFTSIDSIHVMAWEGGHHDHDALHALTAHLAAARGLLARTWQFSLYQSRGLGGPWFRVLAPITENGPVTATPIPWRARLRYLALCLSYPSQRVTWIGLFPFVLLHYLLRGDQALQHVTLDRIAERPHAGPLYYEKRKFFTWQQLSDAVAAWRARQPRS